MCVISCFYEGRAPYDGGPSEEVADARDEAQMEEEEQEVLAEQVEADGFALLPAKRKTPDVPLKVWISSKTVTFC